MTKKDILEMETIAYYSGFDGLEIKGIEYGTDDHVLCVSGAWNGKPKPHRLKIYYTSENAYIKLHGYIVQLNECIRTGYKIMRYSFKTSTTLKETDQEKWWLDDDLVKPIELEANNLMEALEKYREIVNDTYNVQISKNAMHKKENMYMDINPGGQPKQIGYVITGSTFFERDNGGFVNKFIDLWVEIRVVSYPAFE